MTEFEYNRDEVPQEVLLELVLDFNRNFAGYVKEVDADLFERAKDYARSFTEVEGYDITFLDIEGDEND
ncbi:hypothetical protein [Hyphomonas sp.]|jgi:hypothetical protein|uniref:hypothetical protein n=1 Tax=Hyphomonas sp. TaxID=87 RepID=UPI000C942551|nr:hypothetical protein [Hyphomonas sp.]MAL43795.1 hypothetical protein [Hyphomonas sp.]|tara:strand:+ start:232 stop:438 length:207 start_codon:yes stop_codon:yes gene_type:complete